MSPPRANDILAVILWMAGALVSFSATAIALRELAGALPLFDSLAARSATGVAIVALVAIIRRDAAAFRLRRMGLHLARNLVHFASIFAWSFSLSLLPLATVFALEFTAPAWVTLLATLVLGERLTGPRLAAVVLGIVGVLVILRPGAEAVAPASFLVLAAALGFAIVTTCTKALTRTETTAAILFWMSALQLPLNLAAGHLLPALAPGALPASITAAPVAFGLRHALALATLGLGGFASHWCLTNAYQRGDAILVLPLDFLRIPLIALVGWQIYGERLDPILFVGAGLIVAGILWSLTAEARGR